MPQLSHLSHSLLSPPLPDCLFHFLPGNMGPQCKSLTGIPSLSGVVLPAFTSILRMLSLPLSSRKLEITLGEVGGRERENMRVRERERAVPTGKGGSEKEEKHWGSVSAFGGDIGVCRLASQGLSLAISCSPRTWHVKGTTETHLQKRGAS